MNRPIVKRQRQRQRPIQVNGDASLDAPNRPQGCARFAEILSEFTKTWSSGTTEF